MVVLCLEILVRISKTYQANLLYIYGKKLILRYGPPIDNNNQVHLKDSINENKNLCASWSFRNNNMYFFYRVLNLFFLLFTVLSFKTQTPVVGEMPYQQPWRCCTLYSSSRRTVSPVDCPLQCIGQDPDPPREQTHQAINRANKDQINWLYPPADQASPLADNTSPPADKASPYS